MNNEKTIILFDSPEAASIQTVTGWVGADGHFWGDNERQARYGGCTHKKCETCGTIYRKNSWCDVCHRKKKQEQFDALPVIEWDGKTPLALYDSDEYFFDSDAVYDYADAHEIEPEKLPLVACVPNRPHTFDANDMFCDYLAEDCDLEDSDILDALDALNNAIEKAEPLSWLPGNQRVILPSN